MMGYIDRREETAEVIRDGWFYTGDLGKFDANGNLWITRRKKNVMRYEKRKKYFPGRNPRAYRPSSVYTAEHGVYERKAQRTGTFGERLYIIRTI